MKSQSQVAPSSYSSQASPVPNRTAGVTQALRGASTGPTGLAGMMASATRAAAPAIASAAQPGGLATGKNKPPPQPQAEPPTTQPQIAPTTAQNTGVAPKSQAQPGLNYGKNQLQPRPQDAIQNATAQAVSSAAPVSGGKSMAQPLAIKSRVQPPPQG